MELIKKKITAKLPAILEKIDLIRKYHGSFKISNVTVDQLYNGLRGVMIHVSDLSYLDPEKGLRFRDYPIPELIAQLPRNRDAKYPLAGGLFHLLLTGDYPTENEALSVETHWKELPALPQHVVTIIKAFPSTADPMAIFSAALLAMQCPSEDQKKKNTGSHNESDWEDYLQDGFRLTAALPGIAATIFNHLYQGDQQFSNPELDWGASFAYLIGKGMDTNYAEYCRLFLLLHADEEAGSASANMARLAASTQSDLFSCCAAAMAGLSGHRQGHASQANLEWFLKLEQHFKGIPGKDVMARHLSSMIETGTWQPGNGNGSLRVADPRFTLQLEFAEKSFPDNPLIQLARMAHEILPSLVLQAGRIKSSFPNLGAIDGVIQYCYGVDQVEFYPVLLGMSRMLGLVADVIWSQALKLPAEKTKPLTTAILEEMIRTESLEDRSYGP